MPVNIFLSSSSNELQDGARLGSYIGNTIVSSYVDDELVGMLDAAASELDPVAREQMYHEIMAYNCDNVGILPLLTYLSVNGGADNLSWIPALRRHHTRGGHDAELTSRN